MDVLCHYVTVLDGLCGIFFMTHGSVKTAIVCWSDAACRVLCLLSEHGPLSEVIVC